MSYWVGADSVKDQSIYSGRVNVRIKCAVARSISVYIGLPSHKVYTG